jgi:hypothetical protein
MGKHLNHLAPMLLVWGQGRWFAVGRDAVSWQGEKRFPQGVLPGSQTTGTLSRREGARSGQLCCGWGISGEICRVNSRGKSRWVSLHLKDSFNL